MIIERLRCEHLKNPLGIDEREPRLSWNIVSDQRDTWQAARRITVARSEEALEAEEPDLWDSGWAESSECVLVPYAGTALRSRDPAFWRVEVRDNHGNEAVSATAHWSMGLLDEEDWQAQWIAADPEIIRRDPEATVSGLKECGTPALFRKPFEARGGIRRATLYATARGLFIFRINGKRVGEDCFSPEWTDYRKRIHYRTYDVTDRIRQGGNAIGAILGDGWYSGYIGWQETRGQYGLENSLMAQLELEYEDGSTEVVATDASWKCDTGPILSSDLMMGETFDARRQKRNWDQAAYDDSGWLATRTVEAPAVKLVAQRSQPVHQKETLHPVAIDEVEPHVFVFDLGQNITGWVRLLVREKAGAKITIRHGERLSPDGSLYTENLRLARATDVFICGEDEEEVWQPHFTFHGFQFVEVRGLTRRPDRSTVTGCAVHSDTPLAGHFNCSHEGVNRLWLNGLWSQKDNFLSVPTDCPQRDERLGWMGDAQVFVRTAMYNMDVAAFFTKWMIDVTDAQTPEGIFPDIAPRLDEKGPNYIGLDQLCGGPAWADAGIIIPWSMWKVYGDRRLVECHWKAMAAWMDYLERTNPEGLRVNELGNNYGDWLCIPSDTSFRTHSPMKNLLATAFWADDAAKMAELAEVLGRPDEAARYRQMFDKVAAAFREEFVNPDGSLMVETQTAYLLALAMNLLPDELRSKAAARLVANIESLEWHLSTGFVGIRFLNTVLSDYGYPEVAYKLLFQNDYPSWLYPVEHGATTIWERWNGWTEEDGFFNPHMNSFNHYSLGSVGEWLYSHVAGISPSPDGAGFLRFDLRPFPTRKLGYTKAHYQSIHGRIESHWKWVGDALHWSFIIPANTRARVFVPSIEGTSVLEDGQPIRDNDAVKSLGRDRQHAVFDFPSGTYNLESRFEG